MAAEVQIVISALDKTQGAVSSVSKSMGSLGKVALAGVATAAAAAGAAVVGLGAAALKLAIDAAPLEGIRQTFDNISDSFEDGGQAMLEALQKGSAGMITNRDLMISFNKAAQLVSADFASKLPDAMGYLGKAAAATGQDMGYMLDSLVTGVGRLSPMILDNLGIQVDLTAANEAYAESIGKSTEELTKGEQQTALMNQVLEKLAVNTASMPEVVGSAQQQWASLGVQFQNIKDELGEALLPAFQAVLGWMNSNLMPFITGTLVPWLKDQIPKAIQTLSNFWTNTLQPAIQAVWQWMSTVLIPFLQNVVFPWLQDNIPKALQTLSNFWTNVLKPAIETVWNWMSTVLIPFLANVVYPILKETLTQAIQILSDFWNNVLLPAIKAVWEFIDKYLVPVFKVIQEIVEILLPIAIGILQAAWENVLLPALRIVWDFVENYVTPAFTWLMDKVIKPLTTAIGTGLKNALDWILARLRDLRDLAKAVGDALKKAGILGDSPSAFELSLRGINAALQEMNTMSLPGFAAGIYGAGSTVNNWNLTINEAGQRGNVVMDFEVMKALARA